MTSPTIATPAESSESTAEPGRRIMRPKRLPTGRAMLGAVLVTLAVLGIFVASGSGDQGPSTRYAVATGPIEPGATITAADVTFVALGLTEAVAGTVFTDAEALSGAVAIDAIESGELVHRGHVARAFPGVEGASLEFSFPIARSRAPRTLRVGDAIAILATYGSGDGARTEVIVADATVIAFEADAGGSASRSTAVLTVAIGDGSSQLAAAHAAQTADLTVIRTTKSAGTVLPAHYPGGEQ